MPRVLIAEDDLMIADLVEGTLTEHGYEVCGIGRTVSEALSLARLFDPDLAVLDLRLADGELGTEIGCRLIGRSRVGVLYATANISEVDLTAAQGHACLTKPYRGADLVRALEVVAGIVATGEAIPPFPRGFRILPPARIKREPITID
ncbi:response regulator [uncultured Enterovirga sp.]|uniref:response regulator n=1 Tax=uncultured Enterovirga sp. TaxID=2026352 RepID=UPI0035C9E522